MFTHYRKKDNSGLCYKLISDKVIDFNNPSWHRDNVQVVIQCLQGDVWILPYHQFWNEFKGVELEDLPRVYHHEVPEDQQKELKEKNKFLNQKIKCERVECTN